MPKRILFLDIDGVLNSGTTQADERHVSAWVPGWVAHRGVRCHDRMIERLVHIVKAGPAHIVLSSSWRLVFSWDSMEKLFAAWGLGGRLIDMTGAVTGSRKEEILSWLATTDEDVESYVVLDDYDMDFPPGRFVRTSYMTGLQDEHVALAIAALRTSLEK
jgi:hypothetical protein